MTTGSGAFGLLLRHWGLTGDCEPKTGVPIASRLIGIARDVLELAPPDQLLHDLLLGVLRNMPIDSAKYWEHQRLLDLLNHQPKALLRTSCKEWVKACLLIQVSLVVSMRIRSARSPSARRPPERSAGPVDQFCFRWRGVDHEFSRTRWRLLNSLWKKGMVAEEDVVSAVYDEEKLGETKLRQLGGLISARLGPLLRFLDCASHAVPYHPGPAHPARIFYRMPSGAVSVVENLPARSSPSGFGTRSRRPAEREVVPGACCSWVMTSIPGTSNYW
jgi:hypothetical protein